MFTSAGCDFATARMYKCLVWPNHRQQGAGEPSVLSILYSPKDEWTEEVHSPLAVCEWLQVRTVNKLETTQIFFFLLICFMVCPIINSPGVRTHVCHQLLKISCSWDFMRSQPINNACDIWRQRPGAERRMKGDSQNKTIHSLDRYIHTLQFDKWRKLQISSQWDKINFWVFSTLDKSWENRQMWFFLSVNLLTSWMLL